VDKRNRGEAFQTVEEHIEAGADVNRCRARLGVECVDDSESRLQSTASNSRLERLGRNIEDSSTRRFRTSSGSGWNYSTQFGSASEGMHTGHVLAIRGRRGFEIARPFPIGALMKSYRSASLYTVNLRQSQCGHHM
jgi:hypothetical protein